jgi:hypothetical protein
VLNLLGKLTAAVAKALPRGLAFRL